MVCYQKFPKNTAVTPDNPLKATKRTDHITVKLYINYFI